MCGIYLRGDVIRKAGLWRGSASLRASIRVEPQKPCSHPTLCPCPEAPSPTFPGIWGPSLSEHHHTALVSMAISSTLQCSPSRLIGRRRGGGVYRVRVGRDFPC